MMKAQTGRVSHKSMAHLYLCTPFSKFALPLFPISQACALQLAFHWKIRTLVAFETPINMASSYMFEGSQFTKSNTTLKNRDRA